MRRVTVGQPFQLMVSTVGLDEETLVDVDVDVVAVITIADGTVRPAVSQPTSETLGQYLLTFPPEADLTSFEVVYTYAIDGVTYIQKDYGHVVGDRFFSLPRLRSLNDLEDGDRFPNWMIREARDAAEQFVSDFTGAAWVPEYEKLTLDVSGSDFHIPGRGVRSVRALTVGGEVVDPADIIVNFGTGRVHLPDSACSTGSLGDIVLEGQNVEIEITHGADQPPADLRLATLKLARFMLVNQDSAVPDRARQLLSDYGHFILDVATPDKPTGSPEIDSVLRRYQFMRHQVFG